MTQTLTSSPNLPSMAFIAKDERKPNCTHVLLVTTGSVASVKAPLIVQELLRVRYSLHLGLKAFRG